MKLIDITNEATAYINMANIVLDNCSGLHIESINLSIDKWLESTKNNLVYEQDLNLIEMQIDSAKSSIIASINGSLSTFEIQKNILYESVKNLQSTYKLIQDPILKKQIINAHKECTNVINNIFSKIEILNKKKNMLMNHRYTLNTRNSYYDHHEYYNEFIPDEEFEEANNDHYHEE
jgi:hypothetical protein